MNWFFFIIPVISAFIGWFTSRIAIKMLFYPEKPQKILGITFQGFFPKKQQQLAMELGKLSGNELPSFEEIENKISDPANVEKILPFLETHIDIFLKEKLTAQIPMIGMLIGEKTILQVKGVFMKELRELFPVLMKQYLITLEDELSPEKIVTERVKLFSSGKLEEIVKQAISTECRVVEIIGAVAGFIIGLIQLLLILLIM